MQITNCSETNEKRNKSYFISLLSQTLNYDFIHLQLPGMPVPRHALLLLYTFIAYTAESSKVFILGETLCGGELVDTLQFVCGDRGFYFGKSTYSKYPSIFFHRSLSSFHVCLILFRFMSCVYIHLETLTINFSYMVPFGL